MKIKKTLIKHSALIPGLIFLLLIVLGVAITYSIRYAQQQKTIHYLQEVKDRNNTKEFLNDLTDLDVQNIVWENKDMQKMFADGHADLHSPRYPWKYVNENVEISGSIQGQYTGDADWERDIERKQFDIDDDGVTEDIVMFNTAMNHRPHGVHIYNNNRRIFTLENIVMGDVLQNRTSKGFFVK